MTMTVTLTMTMSRYSTTTGTGWVMWEPNTSDQPVRAVEQVPPASSPPECPVRPSQQGSTK